MDLNTQMTIPTGPTGEFRDPTTDPSVLALSQKVLEQSIPHTEMKPPEPDLVELPGGLEINGKWVTTARVRELNGADEEEIGRAEASGIPERIIDSIIHAGVTHLGDEVATPAMLDRLLIGDRDALLLAIRRVTYGPTVDFERLLCTGCGTELVVSYDLTDVPNSRLEQQSHEFQVTLKGGETATVRMVTVGDQKAVLAATRARELTQPEQDTIMLARTVQTITGRNGTRKIDGSQHAVRMMSMADRRKIVRELDRRRIGPRFEEAKVSCTNCGQDVGVPLLIQTLFRG